MIEIGTEVELFHPVDRAWRALTDRALLAKWFAEVAPGPDGLTLRTAGLPGFDADLAVEVREMRAPQRLALSGREGERLLRLTAALAPTAHGCRLSVRETLERGDWDEAQRARREEQHQQALSVRLPAILDWLAFQQVDLRRAEGALTAELPVVRPDRRTGRRWALVTAGLAGLALAGGAAVWVTRPTPEPPQPLPEAAPLVMPSARSRSAAPRPSRTGAPAARGSRAAAPTSSAPPSRTASPRPAPTATLAAGYRTVTDRIFGYRGEVTVDNAGKVASAGWTVTVTLGDGATLGNVSGAEFTQDGRVVTFVGAALPAGSSATFRFDVRDPDPLRAAPDGCAVGGTPCAGL